MALASLLGVLAILTIVFVILRSLPESPKASEDAAASSITLTSIKEQNLRSVTVEHVDGGFELELDEDGDWVLSGQIFPLNLDEVQQVTRTLASIESGKIIGKGFDGSRLPEFGLDNPVARIIVTDKSGAFEVVEVGNKSPVSKQHYARREGSYDVALLPSKVAERVFMDGKDFRDMSLPAPNLDEIARLEFRRNGRIFRITPSTEPNPYLDSASDYVITSPYRGKYYLDEGNFRIRINEETPLPTTVLAYLDNEDPEDARFGLVDEKADMLYISDRDGTVLHLILGASDGEGNRYAQLDDGKKSLFKLRESELGFLDTEPLYLTSKFVFLASIERVAEIEIKTGGDVWMLTRIERDDAETTRDDLFLIDNLEITFEEYSSLFQNLIGILREDEIQEERIRLEPEVSITVTNSRASVNPLLIRYWNYDDVHYQVGIDADEPEFLVGRHQIQKLIRHLMALSPRA